MNVEQLITRHEGNRQFPYCDRCGQDLKRSGWTYECGCMKLGVGPGNITIGVGRNLSAGGLGIGERDHLLANDVLTARQAAMAFQWFSTLDQVRASAIVDLVFNLGPVKFAGFPKFIAAMAARDYDRARLELLDSLAAHEEPMRIREVALMLVTGEWPQGEF